MMTPQERKRQERQARRRRIQEAARPVFFERGFDRASIEQIAKQAQLSVGAIYLYFQSKEDLYVSLLEVSLRDLDGALTEIRDTEPGRRLARVWETLDRWVETEPESGRTLAMLVRPGLRDQLSADVQTGIAAALERLRGHLEGALVDGVSAGTYWATRPGEVADMLWTMFIGSLAADGTGANFALPAPTRAALFATVEAALHAPARVRHAA